MSYFTYQSKKIFYSESGTGRPVMMLHGNTASSKLFELFLPLYQQHFKVILIDFLGNGESDRVPEFPADLWIWQAHQATALIEHLNCGKVSLIGTSGGAWTALNAALQRPDLVDKVVADSFHGRTLPDDFSDSLTAERTAAKNDPFSRQLYEWWQGEDWEQVVDLDTAALVKCAKEKLPLFCRPLESLAAPVLFTGSLEDNMCKEDFVDEYREMTQLVPDGEIHIFKTGGHPAIATNGAAAAEVICNFINR